MLQMFSPEASLVPLREYLVISLITQDGLGFMENCKLNNNNKKTVMIAQVNVINEFNVLLGLGSILILSY